jgi:hypothetical protein
MVTATLAVTPYDETTSVALLVTLPDASTTAPVVTAGEGGVWSAPVVYTLAGVWRLSWTVTGTGASVEHELVSVAPVPSVETSGRVYATTTQLAEYLGAAPPTDAARLLADASRMLDALVLTYCRYDVDETTGMPTNPGVTTAIGRAVCAQVAWWGEVGDSIGAAGAGYGSVSIGSVSLGATASASSGADSTARQIAPQVWDELRSPTLHDQLTLGALAVSW